MCQRQNVQGDIFYMNMKTNEVSLDPPANTCSPPAPPLPQGTLTRPSYNARTPAVPVVSEQPASVLAEYGDWAICEDNLGEFYYHWPTNQSYDNPPAELIQLCQVQEQEDRPRQYHTMQPLHPTSLSFSQPLAGQIGAYRSSDYVSTTVSSIGAYRSSDYVREEVKQPSAVRVVYQAAYAPQPQQTVKYTQHVAYTQPIYQYANSDRRIVVH